MLKEQAVERDRRQILRGILEHRSFDASKALLHGCDQQTVTDRILAFRRGPIRFRHNAMIACEGDPTDSKLVGHFIFMRGRQTILRRSVRSLTY
jgi:hypothetical protein